MIAEALWEQQTCVWPICAAMLSVAISVLDVGAIGDMVVVKSGKRREWKREGRKERRKEAQGRNAARMEVSNRDEDHCTTVNFSGRSHAPVQVDSRVLLLLLFLERPSLWSHETTSPTRWSQNIPTMLLIG